MNRKVAHVIFLPVTLSDFLLADGNSTPSHPHDGNTIHVILVQINLEFGEVPGRPLLQSPALYYLGRLLEVQVLATNIAVKDLKLAAFLGSFKDLWWRAREGGYPLRVCKGLVHLFGCRSKLLGVCDGRGVDGLAAVALSTGRGSGLCWGRGLSVVFGCGEAAGRIRFSVVLDILAVFCYQRRRKLQEFAA